MIRINVKEGDAVVVLRRDGGVDVAYDYEQAHETTLLAMGLQMALENAEWRAKVVERARQVVAEDRRRAG